MTTRVTVDETALQSFTGQPAAPAVSVEELIEDRESRIEDEEERRGYSRNRREPGTAGVAGRYRGPLTQNDTVPFKRKRAEGLPKNLPLITPLVSQSCIFIRPARRVSIVIPG